MTEDQARDALAQRGFVLGNVTTVLVPGVVAGTIVAPVGLNVAPTGSKVDLSVAGTAAATKLAFNVVGTKFVKASQHGVVAARISVTKPASVVATLASPKGKKLRTWRFSVRAGVSIVRLHLPKSAETPGRYRLIWVASTVAGEHISHTIIVQVVAGTKISGGSAQHPVDVVLVGADSLGPGLAISLQGSNVRVLTAEGEDPTFALAGAPKYDVRVVVVDVDKFRLALVHDLRVVFPNVEVVALTGEAGKLAKSVSAGATVALPRTTPPGCLSTSRRDARAARRRRSRRGRERTGDPTGG